MDGYRYISEMYAKTGILVYKRKNQNLAYQTSVNQCSEEDGGVDLNRNYAWAFGDSLEGSSSDPCSQIFRGPSAFSEPETRAVRDLIGNKSKEVKVVYNFHAYGNMFLHPFSSDDSQNSKLVTEFPEQARIYREIWEDNGLPHGNRKGNGERVIDYQADGDASDWILDAHGIVSADPELGTLDYGSYDFFIFERPILLDILNQNVDWVLNTFKKLGPQLGFNHINTTTGPHESIQIEYEFLNKGFSDMASTVASFQFEVESDILNLTSIENADSFKKISETRYQVQINNIHFRAREGVRIIMNG